MEAFLKALGIAIGIGIGLALCAKIFSRKESEK